MEDRPTAMVLYLYVDTDGSRTGANIRDDIDRAIQKIEGVVSAGVEIVVTSNKDGG